MSFSLSVFKCRNQDGLYARSIWHVLSAKPRKCDWTNKKIINSTACIASSSTINRFLRKKDYSCASNCQKYKPDVQKKIEILPYEVSLNNHIKKRCMFYNTRVNYLTKIFHLKKVRYNFKPEPTGSVPKYTSAWISEAQINGSFSSGFWTAIINSSTCYQL